ASVSKSSQLVNSNPTTGHNTAAVTPSTMSSGKTMCFAEPLAFVMLRYSEASSPLPARSFGVPQDDKSGHARDGTLPQINARLIIHLDARRRRGAHPIEIAEAPQVREPHQQHAEEKQHVHDGDAAQ